MKGYVNMKKRLLSLLLCAVMFVGLLPAGVTYVFAEDFSTIEKIDIYVTEPKAGSAPVYSATVPSNADYCVETNNSVEGFKNGVAWMGDKMLALPDGAKFALGNKYTVLILVKSEDYQISRFADADSIKVTVNGNTAGVIPYSANRYGIYYTFELEPTVIDTLDVAIPEPKDGMLITSDAVIASGSGYSIENRSDGAAWECGVKWAKRGMTLNPQEENRFEAGESYTVSISLVLTDETLFEFANQMDLIAYVNDKWADFDKISDSRINVSYTFTVPCDMCNVYWYLDVTSTEPTTGAEIPRGEVFGAPPTPQRYEFDFAGWYIDRALSVPYDPNAPITEDLELFPKWIMKANPFTDISETAWYFTSVMWAYYHVPQITTGSSATTFSPNVNCTREQVVTFLWRAFGSPEPQTTENPFTDVKAGQYYSTPVLWAVENGITSGIGNGKFGTGNSCTRGQIVKFLYAAFH